MYDLASQGQSDVKIGESNPAAYMRYYKAVDRVRLNYARLDHDFTPVEVLVLLGPPGCGKTRRAHEIDPNLHALSEYTSPLWFDGYTDQDTLLLDDFNGGIKFTYLLRLLDGYKFNLPIKGGFTWKRWKRVIITSNYTVDSWYNSAFNFGALVRRISEVIEFKK